MVRNPRDLMALLRIWIVVMLVATLVGATGVTVGATDALTPTIGDITPSSGPTTGDRGVVITGTNLSATTDSLSGVSVTFGGKPAQAFCLFSHCDLHFVAVIPPHDAGIVDVTVTTAAGSATKTGGFTYTAASVTAPTIASLSPDRALATANDTFVAIVGTGFQHDATVTFGGTPARHTFIDDEELILTVAPAHDAGVVDVVVTNPDGQHATASQAFTYQAAPGPTPGGAPTITTLDPATIETGDDETDVTIHGTNFQPGATVTFGGVAVKAGDSEVIDSATIRVLPPQQAAGVVDVVVTNPDGQHATAAHAFTYLQSSTVTAISPPSGPSTGGFPVTLTGSGFKAGASVRFGDTAATNVVVQSGTTIVMTAPPHPAGAVRVTIIDPGTHAGTKFHQTNFSSAAAGTAFRHGEHSSGPLAPGITFTYTGTTPPVAVNPTISHVTPDRGSTEGGKHVVITGTGFASGMKVTFGGIAATNILVLEPTTVLVTTPAHVQEAVDVTVTDANGAHPATLAGGYRYVMDDGSATSGSPVIVPVGGSPPTPKLPHR